MEKTKDIQPGRIIKAWIKRAGLTQLELSERLHISQGALSAQLTGRRPVPRSRLSQLIEILNPPAEEVKAYMLAWAQSKYNTTQIAISNLFAGGSAEPRNYLPPRITADEAAELGLTIAPDEIEYTQPKSERENLLKLYDMLPKNKQRELFNIAVKLNLLEPLPGAIDPPEEKSKK